LVNEAKGTFDPGESGASLHQPARGLADADPQAAWSRCQSGRRERRGVVIAVRADVARPRSWRDLSRPVSNSTGTLREEALGMTKGRERRRGRLQPSGFTMIEIMLVLALVGLIMGAIVVKLRRGTVEAQRQIARVQIHDLAGMFLNYRVGNSGDCPTIAQWIEDKTLKEEPKDPWGHALTIVCPGQHDDASADIVSLGPDGQANSKDDIQSWTLK
jgi:general secretion pathway protein G